MSIVSPFYCLYVFKIGQCRPKMLDPLVKTGFCLVSKVLYHPRQVRAISLESTALARRTGPADCLAIEYECLYAL